VRKILSLLFFLFLVSNSLGCVLPPIQIRIMFFKGENILQARVVTLRDLDEETTIKVLESKIATDFEAEENDYLTFNGERIVDESLVKDWLSKAGAFAFMLEMKR
jgi:hypothetical protein